MNKKILIIEDDAAQTMVLESYLEAEYSTYYADNNVKVFNILKNTKIDAVLLDLNLPGMNGFDIMKETLKYRKKMPILVLTGDAHEETVRKAISGGAADYIAKPVNREVLLERVKRILQKKTMVVPVQKDDDNVASA